MRAGRSRGNVPDVDQDPSRIPRTDLLLADPRLAAAERRLGRKLVKVEVVMRQGTELRLASADDTVLSEALAAWYETGEAGLLDAYSATCLRRVWRVQHFSWWMTTLTHRFDEDDAYGRRLQASYRDYVCTSTAAATSLAENYVGLERV